MAKAEIETPRISVAAERELIVDTLAESLGGFK
jgi:hypothetical protein